MDDRSIKDTVRQEFARHAQKYVTSNTHAHGSDLPLLREWLGLESNRDRIALDIATGGGHVVKAIAPYVRQVIASDLTEAMLYQARQHLRQAGCTNVIYVVADAESLPFLAESVDLVTCRIAPHHFPHPDRFVSEVARVLRPGGQFLLIDNIAPEDEKSAAFINALEKLRDISHVRCLPISEWRRLAVTVGLTVVRENARLKQHEFDDWVRRTAHSSEQMESVAAFVRSADQSLQAEFAIHFDEQAISTFCTQEWMALFTKQSAEHAADQSGQEGWGNGRRALISGFDHVQLAAPAGCETQARHFFGTLLGLAELPKPAALQQRGGVWFQCGEMQLHIGVETSFSPARKAHPAFLVQSVSALRERLAVEGVAVQEDDALANRQRVYASDPFGNRLEFVEAAVIPVIDRI